MRLRTVTLFLVLVALIAGVFGWLVLTPVAALREGALIVNIPPHEGLRGIGQRLAEAGVIRSQFAFLALTAVRGSMRELKAGEYEVPQGGSTYDVVRLL